MTLELPSAVEADVVSEDGAGVADVLVALDLLHAGRYYYGTHLGLTDANGRVRLERSTLERDFAEDQRLFPMDYRVPLAECDAEAALRVDGGAEFARRRLSALDSPLVAPEALTHWQAAANEGFHATQGVVRLDRPGLDGVVRTRLTVRRATI